MEAMKIGEIYRRRKGYAAEKIKRKDKEMGKKSEKKWVMKWVEG